MAEHMGHHVSDPTAAVGVHYMAAWSSNQEVRIYYYFIRLVLIAINWDILRRPVAEKGFLFG